jgi:predicted outer membrane repeat protein
LNFYDIFYSFFNNNSAGNCGNDVSQLYPIIAFLSSENWINSYSGSPPVKLWGANVEWHPYFDYGELLPDFPTVSNPKDVVNVSNSGIDELSCYYSSTCATITFASNTPLSSNKYMIKVAAGTYFESRIFVSSKDLTIEGSSKSGCVVVGNLYTHVFECIDSGSLNLSKFSVRFYPLGNQLINMIHFNSSGSFIMFECSIEGHPAQSSNSYLIGSSYSISFCDYSDIECIGTDKGAAIFSEIGEGKELLIEYSTFTRCKQSYFLYEGTSQGGAIMAYGSDSTGTNYQTAGAGTLIIKNCNFISCSAVNDGGSICIRGPSAKFIDCRFVDNFCTNYGGAIAAIYRFSYNFTRCVFLNCKSLNYTLQQGNLRHGYGGGICLWDELDNVNPSFTIDHCYFEGNSATAQGYDVSLSLTKNHFADTAVQNSFSHSISRTRRSGNNPGLVRRSTPNSIFNNLVPYSYEEYLYVDTTHKDIEYCGCIDYRCRTIEYTYGRYV